MKPKLSMTLALAFAVLLVGSLVALAASEKVSGTVQSVDPMEGTFTLVTSDNQTRTLSASKQLLRGLNPASEVDVTIKDGIVTKISGGQEKDGSGG